MDNNELTREPGNPELSFLSALSSCRLLEKLHIGNNPLNGTIPDSIGNLSSSLQLFTAYGSSIKGVIPEGVGYLRNLTKLDLGYNELLGTITSTIGELKGLQRLYLDNNEIEGLIPEEFCHLSQLGELTLQNNDISGSIPYCIGDLSHLQKLFLSSNRLTSSIPENLWGLENLLFLNLSSNYLGGSLPHSIRKSDVIEIVDLSWNQISGNIPSIIGSFESLSSLNLSRNSFQGSIPETLGDLKALNYLDLSYNNLSSSIPKSLEALSLRKYLNLSFNKLSGEIPTGGPFANFTAQTFLKNEALCGNPILLVSRCPGHNTRESRTRKLVLKYILPATASIIILLALIYMLRRHRGDNERTPTSVDLSPAMEHKMISYQELKRATNNFCESNLPGEGSFGSVYKGILSDRTTVAVKILHLNLEGAIKSFDAECKVLRTVRHRNLIKVISSCSNPELRALVLQYMSNGSFEKWLYSHNHSLDLLQRLEIMVNVAVAMEYLHHGQAEPVVHCDLKPSNILLDQEMVGHVGDFGIPKILLKNKYSTQTKTLGTLGYIAPEYGSEGKVSTKGDIYSYGIILLETITRKRPTAEMFVQELSLRGWVRASLPNNIEDVIDRALLSTENEQDVIATKDIISCIIELGLECSDELPEKRVDMNEVVVKLNKIKYTLLQNKRK